MSQEFDNIDIDAGIADGEKHLKFCDETGIDERILRAVQEMGFDEMTPIQERAIPIMMSGRDVIGQAQTGTGKTAAFGIPLLQKIDPFDRSLQALIICPTRELAMQAAEEMKKFSKYLEGIRVLPVYGGQDIVRQIRALKGGVQVVVGTPGRIMDHMRRGTLKTDNVETVVLDEADEMLDMGFREDMETILQDVPEERQVALFSATMPGPILELTRKYQKDAEFIKVTKDEITIDTVKQSYYRIRRDQKKDVLCILLDYYNPRRCLIFCNTKRMVDELNEYLKDNNYSAEGLHGDLTQGQRDTVMNLFKSGRSAILIATDVAARGLDIDNVEAVINFDVPDDIEYYVHRIGRTGRAGKTGRAFSLVAGRDILKIRDIERVCKTRIKEKNLPSSLEVMSRKADKILTEVLYMVEHENLTHMEELIEDKLMEGDITALHIAAAFLKQQMGEPPKDIKADDEYDEYEERSGRGRGRGRRRDKGRYRGSDPERRDGRDRDRSRDRNRDRNRDKNRDRNRDRDRDRSAGTDSTDSTDGFFGFCSGDRDVHSSGRRDRDRNRDRNRERRRERDHGTDHDKKYEGKRDEVRDSSRSRTSDANFEKNTDAKRDDKRSSGHESAFDRYRETDSGARKFRDRDRGDRKREPERGFERDRKKDTGHAAGESHSYEYGSKGARGKDNKKDDWKNDRVTEKKNEKFSEKKAVKSSFFEKFLPRDKKKKTDWD